MRLALLVCLIALLAPAAARADCPDTISVERTGGKMLRHAEYLEVFPGDGSERVRKIGAPVESDDLPTDGTYYVPEGTKASFTVARMTYTVHSRTIFVFFCLGRKPQLRVLEGRGSAKGTQPARRPHAQITTIEGSFAPRPGRADFEVVRDWRGHESRTFSRVEVHSGVNVFARHNRVPGARRQPCTEGASITFYLDGRTR